MSPSLACPAARPKPFGSDVSDAICAGLPARMNCGGRGVRNARPPRQVNVRQCESGSISTDKPGTVRCMEVTPL